MWSEITPEIRDQVERYMGDRERCMPSERAVLERQGFKAIERQYPNENAARYNQLAATIYRGTP